MPCPSRLVFTGDFSFSTPVIRGTKHFFFVNSDQRNKTTTLTMESEIHYKLPPYISEVENGNIVVTMEIKGLQKKSKTEAKNATVSHEFKERAMCIKIDGIKGKMENKHYQLMVKKLPGEIDPNKCTLKLINDNMVEVRLIKADKEPWDLKHGLETYKEEMDEA